ncbi:MAG: protein kinase, partial [Vicinamibacteria bacterium]
RRHDTRASAQPGSTSAEAGDPLNEKALKTIGRFEIRRELGRGTMGVVYEAYDSALHRRIALKTISLRFAPSEEERDAFEKRFLAEARIAAALSHPAIVVVHDVGRDEETGVLFIALEYLEGRTLGQVLKEGPKLGWREALGIVRDVADALHHAHSRGIVHRDVKPANIMILPGGQPKIMDFGIARIESSTLTAAGEILGTPLYMSPEQARGEKVDARADLFSLGAIAYALLVGRAAFVAEDTLRVIWRVIQEEPEPPSALVPGVPADVDHVVARALAKQVAERYPDGQAMAEDIEDILGGRAPRHAGGASPEARLPDLELDEVLVDPTRVAAPKSPAAPQSTASPVSFASLKPRPASRRGGWAIALVAVAVLGALAVLYVALAGRPSATTPTGERPASTEPSTALAPAQLVIDFEHPVKTGLLRAWVDDQSVVEQEVDSRVIRDVGALKLRKGRLEKTLEVAAGVHEVRVQFSWDDNVKSERASATFKNGVTRRLEARIGRLRKNLSLEWK